TRSAHAKTSPAPAVAGPVSRARKRIGSAKATAAQDRLIALVERGIAAVVVEALIGIGRAPASAGPRRLAPLRARPAFGVSLGELQSHYCDTEQNKTDRAYAALGKLCATFAREDHEAALRNFDRYFGEVSTIAKISGIWAGQNYRGRSSDAVIS